MRLLRIRIYVVRVPPLSILLNRAVSSLAAVRLIPRVRPRPIRGGQPLLPLRRDLLFALNAQRSTLYVQRSTLYVLGVLLHLARLSSRRRAGNHLLSERARDHFLRRLLPL